MGLVACRGWGRTLHTGARGEVGLGSGHRRVCPLQAHLGSPAVCRGSRLGFPSFWHPLGSDWNKGLLPTPLAIIRDSGSIPTHGQ